MKCSSCGKQFDYEKYYGICPKCGVYQKQKGNEEEQFFGEEMGNDRIEPYDYERWHQAYRQPEPKKGMFRSTLILGILVVAVIVAIIVVVAAGAAMTGYVEEASRIEAKNRVLEKAEVTEISLGDKLGQFPVTVERVEVLADANQVEGFPEDEILLGVRVVADTRDQKEAYVYDSAPVDFYLQYDGKYRSSADSYCFDPDYLHVLQGRKDYTGYGSYDAGYLYFFLPMDAEEYAIYVQAWDDEKEKVKECCRIPFVLDSRENGGVQDEQ